MIKNFLGLIIFLIIQVISLDNTFAFNDHNVREFLDERENLWPELYLPNFKFSNTSRDLIYPNWFEGNWLVTSQDLEDESQAPVIYKVNFFKNNLNEVIGNRSKNSESIGKAIFGDTLIKVVNDPKSINKQITYLKDDLYIDSRITGRNQIQDDDMFFADELVIQTLHKPGASRVNQVETISKFQKCNPHNSNTENTLKPNICGFQYIATYGSKVGDPSVHAIKTSKFKLSFEFIES